jgi:hypothetical protein
MMIEGRSFDFVVASDVQTRDGLGVELNENGRGPVAEVFRSDLDGTLTFTAFEENLPLRAVEMLLEHAREVLLKVPARSNGEL